MVRIAVAQMDASAENLARAEALVAEAAAQRADFVVLPELAGCPWLPAREEERLLAAAEDDDGPTLQAFQAVAARQKVNLVVGLYEVDGDRRYSTAYVLNRSGQVVGKYRKNHIPYEQGWYEKFYYGPGDSGYPVFEHEGLRFGIQICWDNMYVEGTRSLALDGAQVIFSPRATGRGSLARWRAVLQANAYVNQVFIATANRVGEDRGILFGGGSLVAGPAGEVIAEVTPGEQPGVAVVDLDLTAIDGRAAVEPFFANRRPEIYTRLMRR